MMTLYFKHIKMLWKSQLQYRGSFLLLCVGQFFVPFVVFAGMYFLFQRFQHINGWQFSEVLLCFGMIHMAFALSECFVRGFDAFSGLIVRGEFDRILTRPRGIVLQVLGSKFEFTRIGRLAQSIAVLIYGLSIATIQWTFLKILLFILMLISGIFVFSGVFILGATLSFWTIQGLEITNMFTDGGRELNQYPLGIYKKWVKTFFTFVIPFGCVNYYPMLYILDRTSGHDGLYILAPLLGILFIIPALMAFGFGVKHYKSTGS
ncbi:ABC transporter permease [Vallitalea pronyensis]|nr:ABC-2 family transporter protein [Vallitalea pronyensis]